jgi:hypothetical protein
LHNEGTTSLRYTTVTDNEAWTGGGIASTAGSVTVSGSILAEQDDGGDCATSDPGTITSGGHNLASDSTCWSTAGTDLADTDPLLGPLASNGGLNQTHLPAGGSPARDAIPNGTAALCDGAVTTDQRFSTRPAGAACDCGSVES